MATDSRAQLVGAGYPVKASDCHDEPYSVWAGAGIAGVTLIGALAFAQSLDGYAYLGIGSIIAGVIVLNALSSAESG